MSDSDTSSNTYKLTPKMVSTRELIQYVRDRPCLWDKTHPSYRDKCVKINAWQDIYRQFEPSFEALNATKKHMLCSLITKKWYNVRDAYVKSKKLAARNRHRPYLYAEHMQFLDANLSDSINKVLKDERYKDSFEEGVSNEDDADNEATQSWANEEVYVDVDVGDNDDSIEFDHSSSKRPKLEFSTTKEVSELDENVVAVLAHLIQKEEDEDRAFFKSITPAVKKLSESSRFTFRIQVMKLIQSLKVKEKQSLKLKLDKVPSMVSDSE